RDSPSESETTREGQSAGAAPKSGAERESREEPAGIKIDSGVRYGTLVAHGEAPYRHDPTQAASYFVTLKDSSDREWTAWGVGLKDAIRDSKTAPTVNDLIGIRRVGSTPVTVLQRSIDEDGAV